jgi:sporulation protein YlmC with PRC-barrel domain
MKLYAIRRRSAWADGTELGRTAAVSSDVGNKEMPDQVRWIRSYVVAERDGRLGTICLYEATDEAALREHARRVGMPGDEIEAIADTVVIRPDPVKEEA